MGLYIIRQAESFSRLLAGMPGAMNEAALMRCIRSSSHIDAVNDAHQYLQAALTPHFEEDLFEFYRQQQYLILLTFLSYPFRGPLCLDSHVAPYMVASSRLAKMRVLDYGAGIPFGLIHLLRTHPDKVQSVTIVDLDLIHAHLVEHILKTLAPDADIAVLRLSDTTSIPELGDRKHNLIFGKDVFEHVHNPELLLETMLASAEPSCIAYIDINDHGAKYLQHIHPQLSYLSHVMRDWSFAPYGRVGCMSGFLRRG